MVLYFECNWVTQQKFPLDFLTFYLHNLLTEKKKKNENTTSILENMENLLRALQQRKWLKKLARLGPLEQWLLVPAG